MNGELFNIIKIVVIKAKVKNLNQILISKEYQVTAFGIEQNACGNVYIFFAYIRDFIIFFWSHSIHGLLNV